MSTISEYEQGLATLKRDFAVYNSSAIEYIENTWLGPYMDRFVAAWTDNIMHLGNLTSNRAESAQKLLKGHLASSQGNFENAWAKMHDLIGLQITGIKASFEKSLTCWQHIFRIPIFSQVRGAVSQSVMKHMMPEVHKANEMVLDATSECNCPIRRTHGLPCAHEIAKFKNDGIPLPLYLIDNHWKTLSLEKPKHDDSIVQVMEADFNNFLAKVKTFNDKSQQHWMKTIKECLHPSTTSLSEPQQKAKTKGRPIGSLNTSTRKDPSEFEYVEAAMKTPQAKEKTPKVIKVKTPEVVKEKTPKVVKENPHKKLKVVASLFRSNYVDEFPEPIRCHIKSISDVMMDGNCGYRAVVRKEGLNNYVTD